MDTYSKAKERKLTLPPSSRMWVLDEIRSADDINRSTEKSCIDGLLDSLS